MHSLIVCIILAASSLSTALAPDYRFGQIDEEYTLVPEEYVVKLAEDHTIEAHFNYLGRNISEFQTTGTGDLDDFEWIPEFHGYWIRINETFLESYIRHDPGVEWFYQSRALNHSSFLMNTTVTPTNYARPLAPSSPFSAQKKNLMRRVDKEWNRIKENLHWSARQLLYFGKDPSIRTVDFADAYMLDGAGWGVDVYVLDTGVRIEHELLNTHGTKATRYKTKFIRDIDGDTWKTFGHGTAVAGVIKSVAPHSNIIDVKVLGIGASSDNIGRAIHSVTRRHISLRDRQPKLKDWFGSVINLSLSTSDSVLLRRAVSDAIEAGIPVVASSGNYKGTECRYPALYPNVICVGGITRDYTMYELSNHGKGVTVWAAGKDVYTATKTSDSSYGHFDGTSFASPLVAGIIATFIGYEEVSNDAELYRKRLEQNWNEITLDFDNKRLAQTGIDHPYRDQHPYYGPETSSTKLHIDNTNDDLQGPDQTDNTTLPIDGPIIEVDDDDQNIDSSVKDPISIECYPPTGATIDNETLSLFIDAFCDQNNGKVLVHRAKNTMDGAIWNNMTTESLSPSAEFYAFLDNNCYIPGLMDSYALFADDCKYAIRGLLAECPADTDQKPGGGVNYRCQYYNVLPQQSV